MSTPKYHHGDVPQQTLRAARELLRDGPASQISVRELARAAGVSHAAPYRHFGDRDGFLLALTQLCFREFVTAQQEAFDAATEGSRLLAVGAAYVEFALAHPYAFELVYAPRASVDENLEREVQAHAALLAAAVDDGARAGMLPSGSPSTIGMALWSLAHGLAHLVRSGLIPADQIPDTLSALLGSPEERTA